MEQTKIKTVNIFTLHCIQKTQVHPNQKGCTSEAED